MPHATSPGVELFSIRKLFRIWNFSMVRIDGLDPRAIDGIPYQAGLLQASIQPLKTPDLIAACARLG